MNFFLRKYFKILLFFLIIFSSCKKDKKIEIIEPNLTISSDDIILDGTATFTIESTDLWSISPVENNIFKWYNISPTTGNAGKTVVTLTKINSNTSDNDRNIMLKAVSGNLIRFFTITQKANNSILLSRDRVEITEKGGDFSIKTKVSCQVEICSGNEWIRIVSQPSGAGEYNFSALAGDNRSGKIVFKSQSVTDTVVVYQSLSKNLILNRDSIASFIKGGTFTLELKPNIDYDISIKGSPTWMRILMPSQTRFDRRYFQIDSNSTLIPRNTFIMVKDRNSLQVDSVNVVQYFYDNMPFLYKSELGIYNYDKNGTDHLYQKFNDQYSFILSQTNKKFKVYNITAKEYFTIEDIPINVSYGDTFDIRLIQNCMRALPRNIIIKVSAVKVSEDRLWLCDNSTGIGFIIIR